MDITKLKHIHFTGIKGVGMTALALYFRDMGKIISGSDTEEVFVTDEVLTKNNIHWQVGFGVNNLTSKPDLLICTAAHGGLNNPEVIAAKKMHIPILTYAEGLALVVKNKKLIATCGVGGKTTTSSIISVMLSMAGLNPSFVVGVGSINPLGVAGHYDPNGKYIVAEADEYAISPGINNNPKFSLLDPKVLIVHNIEHDHPDIYKTFQDTKRAFKLLFQKISKDGVIIASCDNKNVVSLLRGIKAPIITFGFSNKAEFQIKNFRYGLEKTSFSLYSTKDKVFIVDLSTNIPGKYNALNSTSAFLAGKFLGIPYNKIKQGIESYKGCRRRFEKIGEFNGARIYDDYAHHPEEIRSILTAAKDWFPKNRIVAIFQPHTHSRTKSLFKEFSRAFKEADVVGFMDIYASARETLDPSVSSKLLANETKKYNNKTYYLGDHKTTLAWIKKNLKKDDILLTIGAGDIFHIHKELLKATN